MQRVFKQRGGIAMEITEVRIFLIDHDPIKAIVSITH